MKEAFLIGSKVRQPISTGPDGIMELTDRGEWNEVGSDGDGCWCHGCVRYDIIYPAVDQNGIMYPRDDWIRPLFHIGRVT